MSDETTAERPAVGKIRSQEEHAALLGYHIAQIRAQRAAVETAKGPVEEAKAALKERRDELSTRFDQAQIDLGRRYTRKYLEGLIADGDVKIRELVEHETMRARDKVILSQPVFGVQPELFPGEATPTAARDEMAWEAEGFLRGLRGDVEELQSGDPPAFHQAVMRGFREGQKVTGERIQQAMALKQREGEPDAQQQPVDLSPEEPEPGTPEAKAAERKAVRKAKESLEKMGQAGDGFEASEDELSGQSTRKAVQAAREGDPGPAANKVPA
jgi:hypothetical protein